ncbi:carboxylesterase/lipase family protein [Phenylobacterium sp. LH3H17]|uniref:carboxylesterase/lipase family protein n=1 Tax=Phenylobacterium sp. LH3H17 TaxID=2903901 RepID=UPI0020CA219F|nr:carboxylesterase/lipase family protein [Phenylobacterium sp. LH3H17]UTP40302.1 carboxylesterase/lipase family protein [Phenylobacterium sp. LH3H17]
MDHLNRRDLFAAAGLLLPGGAFAAGASPTARTRHGPVRGYADGTIKVFKGVRYGADTGPRRFRPPVAPTPWTKTLESVAHGPASPQAGKADEPQSEDCLFLNVWTPGLRDGARRPVMVYLHGGAYASGSGSSPLYDGARLCRRGDVVVVTLNHRLNVFGYGFLAKLAGPGFADSGNAGMLDIVLALKWVGDNISEFGGDPSRVMVFGQSGGGAKIATMMAMPAAKGLFHSAATMSGQQVTASGPLHATERMELFLKTIGLSPDRAAEAATLPAARLVEGLAAADPFTPGRLYFGPVLDQRSLARHPFYPDAHPQGLKIPMILGNTHDETRAFLAGSKPDPFAMRWEEVASRIGPEMRVDIDPDHVVATYRRLYPHYSPTDVFFAATTAGRSWRGQVIEAEERARAGAPGWVYQLDLRTGAQGGRLGAPHAADIALAFDNVTAAGSPYAATPAHQKVADQMSEAFIALARTGDPNTAALPSWPRYELDRRATMVFDSDTRVVDDPRGDERRLFEAVPYVQPGT